MGSIARAVIPCRTGGARMIKFHGDRQYPRVGSSHPRQGRAQPPAVGVKAKDHGAATSRARVRSSCCDRPARDRSQPNVGRSSSVAPDGW